MMDRELNTLARRVRYARNKRGFSQGKLAADSGLKQPDISKIELGTIGKTTGIARLARALGATPEWLEDGVGPEPDWSAPVGADVARESATQLGQAISALAHPVMLDEFTVPSTITWGDVKTMAKLPARFIVLMPDDALAGHIDKGTALVFERDLAPASGRTVLIQTNNGDRCIRVYAHVLGDHWQAQFTAKSGYVTLDSKEHGLKVLATMKWREG